MNLQVDQRLEKLYDAIPSCNVLADIGTDHGKLPALALLRRKCKRVILVDISASSLQKAKDLFVDLGLQGDFLHSDGLQALQEKVDCIVIAGMGSGTLCQILQEGKEKLGNATLVLSPHLKEEETRAFLPTIGYCVRWESIVQAKRKIYTILAAEPSEERLNEKETFIGKIYDINTAEDVLAYLKKKRQKTLTRLQGLERAQVQDTAERENLLQELEWIREDFAIYASKGFAESPR